MVNLLCAQVVGANIKNVYLCRPEILTFICLGLLYKYI